MFKAFNKIGQYRNAVKDLQKLQLPYGSMASFYGTVKLHGTNAGIGYIASTGEIFCQSRTRIITPEDDNYGFANWVHTKLDVFRTFFEDCSQGNDVMIYGEWCGKGIQSGVAISELPKMFVIFRVEASDDTASNVFHRIYSEITLEEENNDIFFISSFQTYRIIIDPMFPENAVQQLTKITEEVEACCPVGKQLGVEGTGEGVVWELDMVEIPTISFKVKGQKHSVSKVKKIAAVDPEKLKSIDAFVSYAVTENRLNQGVEQLGLSEKTIGQFIGWINKDINTEEADVLEASDLTMKDVGKYTANKARAFYISQLNEAVIG